MCVCVCVYIDLEDESRLEDKILFRAIYMADAIFTLLSFWMRIVANIVTWTSEFSTSLVGAYIFLDFSIFIWEV